MLEKLQDENKEKGLNKSVGDIDSEKDSAEPSRKESLIRDKEDIQNKINYLVGIAKIVMPDKEIQDGVTCKTMKECQNVHMLDKAFLYLFTNICQSYENQKVILLK